MTDTANSRGLFIIGNTYLPQLSRWLSMRKDMVSRCKSGSDSDTEGEEELHLCSPGTFLLLLQLIALISLLASRLQTATNTHLERRLFWWQEKDSTFVTFCRRDWLPRFLYLKLGASRHPTLIRKKDPSVPNDLQAATDQLNISFLCRVPSRLSSKSYPDDMKIELWILKG